MGPVHKSDPETERNMLELDVVALADLCARFLPGMVDARPRGGAQRRLDRRVPAAARPGGVRRRQGVRPLLHAQHRLPSSRAPASPRPCSARARWRPTSARPPASRPRRRRSRSLPIMWVPATEVARAAVAGMDSGQGRGHPRRRQQGRCRVRHADPEAPAGVAARAGTTPGCVVSTDRSLLDHLGGGVRRSGCSGDPLGRRRGAGRRGVSRGGRGARRARRRPGRPGRTCARA